MTLPLGTGLEVAQPQENKLKVRAGLVHESPRWLLVEHTHYTIVLTPQPSLPPGFGMKMQAALGL